MSRLPNISKAYSLVLQEEKQKELCTLIQSNEVVAMAASKYQYNQGKASNYQQGDGKKLCPNCKKPGHTVEKCYWLIGFPPGHKLYNKYIPPNSNKGSRVANKASVDDTRKAAVKLLEFTPEQYKQILALLNDNNKS